MPKTISLNPFRWEKGAMLPGLREIRPHDREFQENLDGEMLPRFSPT